jgi:hypothetical protein
MATFNQRTNKECSDSFAFIYWSQEHFSCMGTVITPVTFFHSHLPQVLLSKHECIPSTSSQPTQINLDNKGISQILVFIDYNSQDP